MSKSHSNPVPTPVGTSTKSFLESIRNWAVRNGGADAFPDYRPNPQGQESSEEAKAREKAAHNAQSGQSPGQAGLGRKTLK